LTTDVLALAIERREEGRVCPAFFVAASAFPFFLESRQCSISLFLRNSGRKTDIRFSWNCFRKTALKPIPDGAFKPKQSPNEAKTDTTTRVAREIIDSESAARLAKTERLRAARLAQEAGKPEAAAKPKKKR